jgi:hypothetical protein
MAGAEQVLPLQQRVPLLQRLIHDLQLLEYFGIIVY